MERKGHHTVNGRNPAPVEVGRLPHYLQDFIHPRWLFEISEPSTVVALLDSFRKTPYRNHWILWPPMWMLLTFLTEFGDGSFEECGQSLCFGRENAWKHGQRKQVNKRIIRSKRRVVLFPHNPDNRSIRVISRWSWSSSPPSSSPPPCNIKFSSPLVQLWGCQEGVGVPKWYVELNCRT